MPLLKDLNKADQELIEDILRKEKNALTSYDKAVLNARKDYVSKEDFERLMGKAEKAAKTEEKPKEAKEKKATKKK